MYQVEWLSFVIENIWILKSGFLMSQCWVSDN